MAQALAKTMRSLSANKCTNNNSRSCRTADGTLSKNRSIVCTPLMGAKGQGTQHIFANRTRQVQAMLPTKPIICVVQIFYSSYSNAHEG
ncbi:hypothetical protein COCSUDRAFT_34060 [Coccomyxa subellipsoidea C-169]|uniref:Uncharacterized protein n=1 Tax=Coccomyxa subellipsoidea (strain C-169) TaxID=574566 RepID=I0YP61_COCSC|nr:hypothetical protein COCSUDRAFT_34060 [Coccomyxa subellipsoidea C-169]EIE20180.1 hypothetical protein COCSUDRAFT_34060 [Coccomyxa subellipsoidea C-169]|eukprot:XP_005644724.1 hypothetical protein COCSUDRAFT_34060 [Coccomyxa subellipsoidea C-169]